MPKGKIIGIISLKGGSGKIKDFLWSPFRLGGV